MIHRRRIARLVFFGAGGLALLAPILREIHPQLRLFDQVAHEQFLAFELFLCATAYFGHRATRSAHLFDLTAAFAALALGVAVMGFLGSDAAMFLPATLPVIGLALAIIALVLFAGAAVAGRAVVGVVAPALARGHPGQFLPEALRAPDIRFATYANYLAYGAGGVLGRPLDIMVNFVLVYLLFGMAFAAAGGGEVIASLALRLAGQHRAHAIKACVVASGLFGMASGTATSNVLTSGAFSLPSMRRIGVRNDTAAGIEAAASTGGQVMPPVMGATAFILADFVEMPYATVALAAVLPGLLCYFAFFRQADLVPLEPGATARETDRLTLRAAHLAYLLPPLAIALVLAQSSAFVGLAALSGAATCVAVSLVLNGARGTLRRFAAKLEPLIHAFLQLVFAAALIGLLLGALHATGLSVRAAITIGQIGQNSLILAVLLTALAAFVMGMGMAAVGVYIVVATTLAPGLIETGVPPLAAHFFVLYCGTLSMITPPVAFAALAASTLAKSQFAATARAAMRFGWVLFAMPFLIVAQPGLVLAAHWTHSLLALFASLTFIAAVTAGRLPALPRLALSLLSGGAILLQAFPGPALLTSACAAVALTVLTRRA